MFWSLSPPRFLTPGLISLLIAWLSSQLGIGKVRDPVLCLMPSNEFSPRSCHPMFSLVSIISLLCACPTLLISIASLVLHGCHAFAGGLDQGATYIWGTNGHLVDLMALPSNVQYDLSGQPFPFFSPYPTPGCGGVNVFAQHPASHSPSLFSNLYAFPPIALIPQLIHFLHTA